MSNEDDIETLKAEVDILRRRVKALEGRSAFYETAARETAAAEEMLRKQDEQMATGLYGVDETAKAMEAQVDERRRLRVTNAALQRRVHQLSKIIAERNHTIAVLDADIGTANVTINELRAQLAAQQGSLASRTS